MVKMSSSINTVQENSVKQEKDVELSEEKFLVTNFIEIENNIDDVAIEETKCGEILFSNKHFKLSCSHCHKKFVKIKSFLKHFLKLHLKIDVNDIKLILSEMLCDEEIEENESLHNLKDKYDNQIENLFDVTLSSTDNIKEENSNDETAQTISTQNEVSNFEDDYDIEDEYASKNDFKNIKDSKSCKLFCPYCNKGYKRKGDLAKHFILCKENPKNFDTKESNDIPLHCKYKCGRTFQRKCDLSHHENHKHNPDGSIKIWVPKVKTYICETCGNCYQRKHYLIQHQRIHTGERPYCCELCPKTFTKRNNLTLHMRHHSQERKFKCQYCGKGLTDANKLRMHEMIHTGLYPFKCDICGKKFPANSKLNAHIKKHINDRIYKCELCEKRFLDPETLKGHAAVHSNEKPFACEICPARFPRKGALRLHMNLHNDKKKYNCKICGMEFHQYNGIYSHYKRHGIKYSSAYEKGEVDGTTDSTKENE